MNLLEIIVQLSNELLNDINATAEFKDFIFPYPFKMDGIRISLGIIDLIQGVKYYPKGMDNEKVSYAYLYNNKINYCIDRSLETPLEDLHDETFEEAVAILEKK